MLASSIHEREDLELRRAPINPVTMETLGESRLLPSADGFELSLLSESLPWAYGAVMDLDRGLLFPGKQWIVAEFEAVHQSFGIGILNGRADDFHTRVEVPASSVPVEMWLHVSDPADTSRFVLQNWAEPLRSPNRLKALWVVSETLGKRAP